MNNPSVAASAGTKHPIWFIITMSAICFMYTDLPLLLGPVTRITFFERSLPTYHLMMINVLTSISLGMN